MFNRLRERASLVYHGGDVSLPAPDPNNSRNNPEAPNDEPQPPEQQLQSAATDTDTHIGTETDTHADTGTHTDAETNSNSSPQIVQGDHPSSEITQLHADDAHTVNNESDSNSQTFFSFFRLSQSASKLTVADAALPEFDQQDDQGEQDERSALPPVVEETSTETTTNHSDSGCKDTRTHSQEKPSLFSRMRITATKALFETSTSATSLTGSIHSLSASRHATSTTDDATSINPPPSIHPPHINSDNIDTSNHSTFWDFSEEIAKDPEICRLTHQIHLLKTEYYSTKESGKHAQRRRQTEYSTLKQYFNSKSRELWFASQKMRRFHGLGEYKSELKRCSLPAHDTSAPTLTMEAKLLRAQHQGAILEHQLAIVHEFQQSMIDYLYTNALPDVKAEQELATIVGKSQLEKMIKARDTMVELFEDCLGLQRKIIAKYRLREIEHSRGTTDGERLKQEVEHLKVLTGEIPAMERNPELRDSAKRRLEQRLQVKERQLERRKSREQDLIKATQKLIDDDRALVGKANEQIASISSHSIDLLLDITGKDDSDDDSGKDHRTESNHQRATMGPQEDMEYETGHDRSQSSLNDTGHSKGSNHLVSTPASAKDHHLEPGDLSATKETHDEMEGDSGHDKSQSSLNDMGYGEGLNHLFSTSVSKDDNAKDHQTEPTVQSVNLEPHHEMENDFGLDTSQSSLHDTAIGDVSNDLFSASVSNGDNVKDKNWEPPDQSVTKELLGDVKSDSDVEIHQSDDTGDGENPSNLVQSSATTDNTSEELRSQVAQLTADSKEGAVNTTPEVSSTVVQERNDASESQGRSRSAANRSSVTAGRNPPPGIARLRALRAARDMDSSDRSLGKTSNHANGDQGASEHSNSESGEDHLEPISPRTNARKSDLGISANQRYSGRASTTAIRSRNELLERARLARLSNQGGTTGPAQGSPLENAAGTGTGSVRPSLGIKATSSRDIASRRSLATTNPNSRSGPGLGGSEHRSSSIVSSSLSSSERPERPRTSVSITAERQARMERIASRRQSSTEVSAIHQTRNDEKPTISAERRAQIRAGLTGRGVGTKVGQGGEDQKG